MKKSENLFPVCLDDKDIIVDYDFWKTLFSDNPAEPISFCTGNNDYEALFFLPNFMQDRAYKAKVLCSDWNSINVCCLQDNGTIWLEDVDALKEIFMADNSTEDTDIFVTCRPAQEKDGRYIALQFNFFHTSPDLV